MMKTFLEVAKIVVTPITHSRVAINIFLENAPPLGDSQPRDLVP
jgi:hypothetical protein